MKIEKLSLNKIRVTVTTGELNVWNINPKEISPDLPQLRAFIASLLEQSYDGIDEELINSNILVEARPHGDDFVFVITRMSADYKNIQKEIARSVKKQKFLSGNYKAKTVSENPCSYFAFDSLAAFAEMLCAVGCEPFIDTKLYRAKDELYLHVGRLRPDFKKLCMILSEYAKPLGHDASFVAYINEHASLFAQYNDFGAIKRCY